MKRAVLILLGISCMFTACSDWTEIRTKGSLVPGEVENYRYIVHNTNIFRRTFSWQDIASDDAYVYDETQQTDLVALGDNTRYTAYYTWSQEIYDLTESDTDFEQAYRAIYYSNVVINEVMDSEGDEEEKQEVRAEALVYRAEAHLALVNMYGKPYRAESASTDQGVPLMTEPRVEGSLPRATVSEVYDQIIDDLTEAIPYLPDLPEHTFYPSKCAAYAFLARAYLYMGDYDNAQANAESALGLQDGLENLNDYYGGDTYPDALEDREVIMAKMVSNRFRPSSASSSSSSSAAGYLVLNEDLLSLFDQENDLRYLFFTAPISDYSSRYVEGRVFRREDFYDSSRGEGRNMGPCVPEMMLIQAECLARSGDYTEAIEIINQLRSHRFLFGSSYELSASNAVEALGIVLEERRRELMCHGLRWFDQRRLENDENFPTQTVTRILGEDSYTLAPEDVNYTFQIGDYYLDMNPEIGIIE